MTGKEFTHNIQTILPKSSEELAAVWIGWAEEMAQYSRDCLKDLTDEIKRGDSGNFAAWHQPRANVESNLQEIHASLYKINQRYGEDICRKIYDLATIPCCLYPLEALNVAEYLHKGGNPGEIEHRCINTGEFEWDIPEDTSLLTPIT